MRTLPRAIRAFAVMTLLTSPALADAPADQAAIQKLLMATFDKPDARLTVDPIIVAGDIAIADWTQGEMGGRALLRRKNDAWILTLCSGDSLKDPQALQTFSLSPTQAQALVEALASAEARLDPARLAKLASFEGVVRMDANGDHPPADGQ